MVYIKRCRLLYALSAHRHTATHCNALQHATHRFVAGRLRHLVTVALIQMVRIARMLRVE